MSVEKYIPKNDIKYPITNIDFIKSFSLKQISSFFWEQIIKILSPLKIQLKKQEEKDEEEYKFPEEYCSILTPSMVLPNSDIEKKAKIGSQITEINIYPYDLIISIY